jgi:hypothetical protein
MSQPADNPSWSATFPDPVSGGNITIAIDAERVDHIRTEHVLNGVEQTAWQEFLGPDLFDPLCHWSWSPGADMTVPQAFAARLFTELEDPLRHPRLIAYTQLYDDRRPPHQTWEVVTRPGVVVPVRPAEGMGTIPTAYIPPEAVQENRNRRWLGAMVARVEYYKDEILIEGRRFIVPWPPDQPFRSADLLGSRIGLTFHSPKVWGFHAIEYEGQTLIVWKKPLPFGPRGPLPQNPLKPKNRPPS